MPRREAESPRSHDGPFGYPIVRIPGSLRNPDEADGLAVEFTIEGFDVTMRAEGADLGNWPLASVEVRPIDATSFEFLAEGDRLVFEPDDPDVLIESRLVKEPLPELSRREQRRSKKRSEPSRKELKAAEKAERDERKAAEKAEREERNAAEKAERGEREAAEKAEREEREAAEKAEREAAAEIEREAAEAEVVELAEREAAAEVVELAEREAAAEVARVEAEVVELAEREAADSESSESTPDSDAAASEGEMDAADTQLSEVGREDDEQRDLGEISPDPGEAPAKKPKKAKKSKKQKKPKKAKKSDKAEKPDKAEKAKEPKKPKMSRRGPWLRTLDGARKANAFGLSRVQIDETLRGQDHRHSWDHGAAASFGISQHVCTICGKIRLRA